MKSLRCANKECPLLGKATAGKIIRHGFYRAKWGRRRRYLCRACGKTFCTTTQTPYHRLQHRRATFDEVAALSVEGLNKSAIARVKRIAWNSVDRWLTKAAESCHRFNDRKITGLAIEELQADERFGPSSVASSNLSGSSLRSTSGLGFWPSTVLGRRSYRNTLNLFRDVTNRLNVPRFPLIATDGFEFYEKVVRRVFGPACLYDQVIKTRRNDRVVRVERRTRIGAAWRWEQALRESEDSAKLNTSFIERLNLTIRQGSAYLCRRTFCYARRKERLAAHLELLRCYYNFVRPHTTLRFGTEVRRRPSRLV